MNSWSNSCSVYLLGDVCVDEGGCGCGCGGRSHHQISMCHHTTLTFPFKYLPGPARDFLGRLQVIEEVELARLGGDGGGALDELPRLEILQDLFQRLS